LFGVINSWRDHPMDDACLICHKLMNSDHLVLSSRGVSSGYFLKCFFI
jgi:hypothetical protein